MIGLDGKKLSGEEIRRSLETLHEGLNGYISPRERSISPRKRMEIDEFIQDAAHLMALSGIARRASGLEPDEEEEEA